MRPLIEILEDERALSGKLDSIYRYLFKDTDTELLEILYAKKERIESDLNRVRGELREYLARLFE
jgi:hypothetical protein